MSADAMVALANNHELLRGNTTNLMFAGGNRDADGTIDRVAGPPEELMPLLHEIKRNADMKNLDLHNIMTDQGGTKYGTMKTQRFNSTLVTNFDKEMIFSEEQLLAINKAYGTGDPDRHRPGAHEYCAWMDFVEDVNAIDASFMPESQAPPLMLTKQPMSAFAQMLDASDGVLDGKIDDGVYEHKTMMNDKRWA